MSTIKIGLVGAGTVGGGVVKILAGQAARFKRELGIDIKLARVADKSTELFKTLPVGDAVCTSSADDVINDDGIQVVVELVGGTTFAKTLVLNAIGRGKHVITANKALIAEHGPEIFEAAAKANVSVYFEAAVGGGMPVIKSIREALVGNGIESIRTIINGTCNYILTRMSNEPLEFADVLKDAQAKGYAEADPTLDIGGGDTGHKVAILASLAGGGYVPYEKISVEGITNIAKQDIQFASELGYVIKLLGVVRKVDSRLDVRVHPAMLSTNHILASVDGVFNAVLLTGDATGEILIYGKGAGELPTASAVVSDIVDVAKNISGGTPVRIPMDLYRANKEIEIVPVSEIKSRYYLRFTVDDTPGVLASIATCLSAEGISVASVMQKECDNKAGVPLVIITHSAPEKSIRAAICKIEKSSYVRAATCLIRIED